MRSIGKIVSVRILRSDSPYVQLTVEYKDDPSRYYLTDGARFETALVKMADYLVEPDAFVVGGSVYYWFSSTIDRNTGKVRYYMSVEPVGVIAS